jgi:hypothetical protein
MIERRFVALRCDNCMVTIALKKACMNNCLNIGKKEPGRGDEWVIYLLECLLRWYIARLL